MHKVCDIGLEYMGFVWIEFNFECSNKSHPIEKNDVFMCVCGVGR